MIHNRFLTWLKKPGVVTVLVTGVSLAVLTCGGLLGYAGWRAVQPVYDNRVLLRTVPLARDFTCPGGLRVERILSAASACGCLRTAWFAATAHLRRSMPECRAASVC
jgi:TRAP-type C4-dicarboxylate transport system permease small subunit